MSPLGQRVATQTKISSQYCIQDLVRDWSIITGRVGGGSNKTCVCVWGGGLALDQVDVLPLQKGGGEF